MKKIIRLIMGISFLSYLGALTVLLFFISRGFWSDMPLMEYMKLSSNFVPFKTINGYVLAISNGSMNLIIPIKNLAGNVAAFLPMGIFLPYFIRTLNRIKSFAVTMTVMILSVEIIQLVTRRGSLDIDDFILNIIGALIGFGLWKAMTARKTRKNAVNI
ncbi:VanZ family protein [Cytobacillus oceanisediminis]|uniref:VanZ family protein n=1 Tax=Cytobacillus TaxID=2675230 RepID=UPI00203F3477|nr:MULTISPECIES: VanZ family protein [Cytobacillus]MBY0158018.1 VanZ family protein [Cytobacillus firmus]MCM3395310.1 VanZ family protein [Cytobacillus oceanisediminis]MCM3529512.1 VanZ family protein [Cytobacillus oceanisediminis]UQX53023.1 VanZ family protein [Cytobacillus pseudoceanisediminis]